MKTRKIGGQRVRYSTWSRWHRNWTPLSVSNMDCGPNCFSLLGYSDWETSNELAKRTPTGLHHETVIMLLDAGYGLDHKWQYIHAIPQLKHYLPNQQATMASVGNEHGGGHYFVILHNNGFWAIDAQSRSQYNLKDYLYMLRSYGRTLYIITSPHVLRKYNQVTMDEVNFFFPD
jgi:hypothetical protein